MRLMKNVHLTLASLSVIRNRMTIENLQKNRKIKV